MLSKKSVRIISTILLVVMLVMAFGNVAFAATADNFKAGSAPSNANDINKIVRNVLTIMRYVGIAIAVIMAMYLGISYITKSPEGKADIKKQLPVYVGGMILLLSATAVVAFIETQLEGSATSTSTTSAASSIESIITVLRG